jgi:predicted unusual protein kinase regulating ubiquinone biosynthesis (AarF/ABC1/UbiB family)
MLPGLFFDALSSISCFPDFPNPFSNADSHAGNLMVQTQNYVPLTLVLLDWTKAGRLSAPLASRSLHTVFTASPAANDRQTS